MTKLLTLPAPVNGDLKISITAMGQLRSMAWCKSSSLSESDKGAIIALEKARMFSGGVLSLPMLIAYHGASCVAENKAITVTSRVEDKEHERGEHKAPYSKAFNDAETAQNAASDKAIRARAWIAAFPAQSGEELALMLLSLIGSHKAPNDLNYDELNALRDTSKRVLKASSAGRAIEEAA